MSTTETTETETTAPSAEIARAERLLIRDTKAHRRDLERTAKSRDVWYERIRTESRLLSVRRLAALTGLSPGRIDQIKHGK